VLRAQSELTVRAWDAHKSDSPLVAALKADLREGISRLDAAILELRHVAGTIDLTPEACEEAEQMYLRDATTRPEADFDGVIHRNLKEDLTPPGTPSATPCSRFRTETSDKADQQRLADFSAGPARRGEEARPAASDPEAVAKQLAAILHQDSSAWR
jgi:hypothetical protein